MKKFWKREPNFKDCPRCGMRAIINAETCRECGLVFSRLQYATNADAKKKIRRRDKEYIIKTSELPSDVSFLKLISYCIIAGLLGLHSFYVGRYWRGLFALIPTLALICFTIFNAQMIEAMGETDFGILSSCIGFFMMLWPTDIVLIFMKKFKVPVAIDIDALPEIEKAEKGITEKTDENGAQIQLSTDVAKEVLTDIGKLHKTDKKHKKKTAVTEIAEEKKEENANEETQEIVIEQVQQNKQKKKKEKGKKK